MRVLQVSAGREWRGGQQQVRLLARELARRSGGGGDVEQRLVTDGASELARRAAADGVQVEPAPWAIAADPRAGWRLARLVRRFQPDILHAHDSHALNLSLAARWLATAFSDAPRPSLVATRRVVFGISRGSSWFRADHVIAVSGAVRDVLLRAGLDADRVTVVYSAVDPGEVRAAARPPLDIRRRLGLAAGAVLAVNPAALERPKDQATLLRAAAAARRQASGLHWIVAGEGRRRADLEAEAAALGVADIVHFVGYVERVEALIAEADVLVMSSREEGLGTAVLQALALGKPVAATRAGGLVELLPADALVAVGDGPGLAAKVLAMLTRESPSPSPSPSLSRLPEAFTGAAMADGALAVYRSLRKIGAA